MLREKGQGFPNRIVLKLARFRLAHHVRNDLEVSNCHWNIPLRCISSETDITEYRKGTSDRSKIAMFDKFTDQSCIGECMCTYHI